MVPLSAERQFCSSLSIPFLQKSRGRGPPAKDGEGASPRARGAEPPLDLQGRGTQWFRTDPCEPPALFQLTLLALHGKGRGLHSTQNIYHNCLPPLFLSAFPKYFSHGRFPSILYLSSPPCVPFFNNVPVQATQIEQHSEWILEKAQKITVFLVFSLLPLKAI